MGKKCIIINLLRKLCRNGFGTKKWKEKFGSFGERSSIEYPAILQNVEHTYIGNNTTILSNSRLQNYTDRVRSLDGIHIGDNCYLGFGLSLLNGSKISIGNSVLMASNILISSENHGMDPESEIPYMDQELIAKDVEIKDGVWIGQNVCILPGVVIGEKSIIGAGSIVTKNIPAYCIAAGNPARIIKQYSFVTHSWESVVNGKDNPS